MIKFITYKASGEIIGSGSCPESMLKLQARPEEGILVMCSDAGWAENYVNEAGEVEGKGEKPSPHHIFDYATKTWVDPRTNETEWPVVRAKRDSRLLASDWTQLPDVPLSTKEAWATYRQALRDVTTQEDPFSIRWPVVPREE